jgi:acylphosphatase
MKRAEMHAMKRLTAYVSGKVLRVGYRTRVVRIANCMGIKGSIEYLSDRRVRIIAEGEEDDLKSFEKILDIKDACIEVLSIERTYSSPRGEVDGFYKLFGPLDNDLAIDDAISILKEMRYILISWNDLFDGKQMVPALGWEGALKDLGGQYSSVDLQHEIGKMRGD